MQRLDIVFMHYPLAQGTEAFFSVATYYRCDVRYKQWHFFMFERKNITIVCFLLLRRDTILFAQFPTTSIIKYFEVFCFSYRRRIFKL